MEKISVIIPVYNVEPYIKRCLDSIVNQTYENLEIIIVDDGSLDGCGAICDEYAKKDSRIIVIHKENEGLCAARNDGIKHATGDWVAFVDSDDWCELDYYEKFISGIADFFPDVVLSGGYIKEHPEKRKKFHTFDQNFWQLEDKAMTPVMANITTFGLPWDKLYKTEFLKSNHLFFDISLKAFEDFEFNFRVYRWAKRVLGLGFIGYHYRQDVVSISKGFNPDKPRINYSFVSKLHDYIVQHKLASETMQAVNVSSICAIAVAMNCYYFHPANPLRYKDLAKSFKDMKTWPYFQTAIWDKNNKYLTTKQIILKYTLRLPWFWPMKILYCAKQKLNG